MIKTESEVEQDFYNGMRQTSLTKKVNGEVYKYGMRPFDSQLEDIVVKVTTLNTSQRQDGVVTFLVYTKNIDGSEFGRMTPNKKRLAILEKDCYTAFNELKVIMENYDSLKLSSSIGSHYDNDLKQSFISMRIKFKYLTTN